MIQVTRANGGATMAFNPYHIHHLTPSPNGGTYLYYTHDAHFEVKEDFKNVIEQFEYWMKAYNLKP